MNERAKIDLSNSIAINKAPFLDLATLAHFGLRNSLDRFLAALVGSIIVLWIWRALHRTDAYPQRRM